MTAVGRGGRGGIGAGAGRCLTRAARGVAVELLRVSPIAILCDSGRTFSDVDQAMATLARSSAG